MKKSFGLLFIFFLFFSFCACKEQVINSVSNSLVKPDSLKIVTQIVGASTTIPEGDGSGSVNFTVTARNATSYQILIPSDNQTLTITDKKGGMVNYIFKSNPGKIATYPIQVTAFNGSLRKDTTLSVTVLYNSKLVWSDEFDGTSLNTANWNVETGIHVNNELEMYTNTGNYTVSGGILTINCYKVNNNGTYGSYTSARINTTGKKSFKYGRVEARLKLPKGLGTWPAFWMLGDNIATVGWPKCGEIDNMEYVGADPLWVQGSLHSQSQYGNNSRNGRYQLPASNDESQWHVYGIQWDATKIAFYVDDSSSPYYTCYAPTSKTADNWPFDNSFFIILNLAFGGDWGGYKGIDTSLTTMSYQIDWVRYYSD